MLEQDHQLTPGTAALCMETMDDLGAPAVGWCVGDDQTEPIAGTFDDSPFSEHRGFDMIVVRDTMRVVWVSNHGSPSGNENPTAQEVLQAVEDAVAAR